MLEQCVFISAEALGPLSSLDYELSVTLRQDILRLHHEIGFAFLYVTHDREEAAQIGTRVVLLKHGAVVKG